MWCLFPAMREACNFGSEDSLNRRHSMTTWGILALAIFLSVGMAEWSKRAAMGEKAVSPQVLERALTIAAKMEDRAGLKVNVARERKLADFLSSISQHPSPSQSERAGVEPVEGRWKYSKGAMERSFFFRSEN